MKIKINGSKIVDENVYASSELFEIEVPIKYWKSSTFGGFSMMTTGKGSYLGHSQMFGGPKGGDLVLFDNSKNDPFFAIMVSMTQDFDIRKGKLEFLCFQRDMYNRIKEGVIREHTKGKVEIEEVMKTMDTYLDFNENMDFCFKLATDKLQRDILGIYYKSI